MENKKSDWLESLSTESWQVEMIASGLAIYGSLSLSSIIDKMTLNSQTFLTDDALDVMGMGFQYLYLAQALMTVCFISHLCLRIIWVGFLGLTSVYPDGVATKNSAYSQHFLQKLKADFSDVSAYTLKLDHLCSRVFSNFSSIAIMMIAFALWILFLVGIAQLIHMFFGIEITKLIVLVFVSLFFILNTTGFLLNSKKLRNTKIGKKYGYQLLVTMLKPILQFAYKPVNYITWIQRTNQTRSEYLQAMFVMVIPIALMSGYKNSLATSDFTVKEYYRLNALPVYANTKNYFDQVESEILTRPLIQSRNISDKNIQLFLPKLYREQDHMEVLCGKLEKDKKAKKLVKERQQMEYFETCASDYYSISFDENPAVSVQFKYLRNQLNDQKGFFALLKIDTLSTGYHELKVHSSYKSKDGESATRVIPFNYFPN